MAIFRKLGIVATTGILGFVGTKKLVSDDIGAGLPPETGKDVLQKAISDSRGIISELLKKSHVPGLTIAVSVNGNLVWKEGFGYKDIENKSPCTPETVMKIASISKCITSAILAKEIELGRLDLDENISKYIPDWPQKVWQNEKVNITPRHLACHMGGIRGYKPIENNDIPAIFRYEEYFMTKRFKSIQDAVKLFQNDPLVAKPGQEFLYSNHGYTLLSFVLEKTSGKKFPDLLNDLFRKFGMKNTFIDDPNRIIYNKTRQYCIRDNVVVNAPHVDSSFKIAGSGLLSSAPDLIQFANVMLSSYCSSDAASSDSPSYERFLRKEFVEMLWNPMEKTSVTWHDDGKYGLGWQIVKGKQNVYIGHSGRSVGTSSALFISLPLKTPATSRSNKFPSSGLMPSTPNTENVVVAVLANMEGVKLGPLMIKIADIFNNCHKG